MIFISINIYLKEIEFTIYKMENDIKKNIEENKIVIPLALEIGERLNYIRKLIITIVNLYSVSFAHITTNEYLDNGIIDILKIEGLLEESLSSCGVKICK
ncbi:MAG: hypothetical protein ACRDA3_04120 [Peptostreptococcaceae bacterium]